MVNQMAGTLIPHPILFTIPARSLSIQLTPPSLLGGSLPDSYCKDTKHHAPPSSSRWKNACQLLQLAGVASTDTRSVESGFRNLFCSNQARFPSKLGGVD